ncbi:hypothetical protein CKO23_23395 [Thiocystis violacea]|nr:hypothetical protein [Thiocystis violacea]
MSSSWWSAWWTCASSSEAGGRRRSAPAEPAPRPLVIGWTGRVDERERSPPNPAPLLVDCAALVHPTEDDWPEE